MAANRLLDRERVGEEEMDNAEEEEEGKGRGEEEEGEGGGVRREEEAEERKGKSFRISQIEVSMWCSVFE